MSDTSEPTDVPLLGREDTREDLNTLEVAVHALRQDVAAYRWAVERRMRRREVVGWALVASALVVMLALGALGFLVVRTEQAVALRAVEAARVERCADLEELRLILASFLERRIEDLRDEGASPSRVQALEVTHRRLIEDRCTVIPLLDDGASE